MTVIKRNALVSYTPRQMFELVNNVADYPRFLPWCRQSHVLQQTEQAIEASLEIAWSGIHKTFTTRNTLSPYDKITLSLVEGPFKSFAGYWEFIALGNEGCKVNLYLEFTLGGSILDKLFESVFNRMANSLVDAFCKRAMEIYGSE